VDVPGEVVEVAVDELPGGVIEVRIDELPEGVVEVPVDPVPVRVVEMPVEEAPGAVAAFDEVLGNSVVVLVRSFGPVVGGRGAGCA
jgi:hypothetical protein